MTDKKSKKKERKTRGLFPRLSLSKVLEFAEKIFELGHGERVRRRTVFDALEKSPTSGTSRLLTTTANGGYNLVIGGYGSEYHSLTELGIELVSAANNENKLKAVYTSLFGNKIFSEFAAYFNDKPVPIDEIALDYLKKNHGLDEDDAKTCWTVFRENLGDYDLLETLSGKEIIINQETALSKIGIVSEEPEGETTLNAFTSTPIDQKHIANDLVQPQKDQVEFVFNIQVVLPENASPETYDSIFSSISKHLLNRNDRRN